MDQQWTNRPVVDNRFAPVGKVTDVLFGTRDDRPEWATVKTGPLAHERLAPLDGAYVTDDGALVLAFDEFTIKHAPRAPRDHVLTPAVAEEATDWFDLD
jgi:hypothetical protein